MTSQQFTRPLIAAGLLIAVSLAARADVIELKDGRKIDGTMSRQGDAMLVKPDSGASFSVPAADIVRVTLTSNLSPDQAAQAEWTRLTLQIKQADDLPTVMAIHERFLKAYPEVALAKDVRNSLAVYQALAAGKAVKFRGRWMPPAQVDVTLKQWAESARPAVDLYKAGRLKEAIDAAKALLADDDTNPYALSVAGLAAYRMNNFTLSRTYFTSLVAADPGSVLGENNLGVLFFQQKALSEGLLHYTKAVQIMPDNRLVLDNIAEAVNAYTGDKNSAVFRALMRQFEQAETKAEAAMAAKGLHRWGSNWVTQEQLDRLVKQENSVQDQMAQLEARYKFSHDTLAALDDQIKQAKADYDTALSNYTIFNLQLVYQQDRAYDVTLAVTQRDSAWQQLNLALRRKTALEAQRDQLSTTVKDFHNQADKLKAALATAQSQYSGIQRIMELGEAENPPAPAAVAIPPVVPEPPRIIIVPQGSATPPTPPPIQPVIVIDSGFGRGNNGRGRGRGGGRGGRGGAGDPPATQPTTQSATQPAAPAN